jgi:hypothetical protein
VTPFLKATILYPEKSFDPPLNLLFISHQGINAAQPTGNKQYF